MQSSELLASNCWQATDDYYILAAATLPEGRVPGKKKAKRTFSATKAVKAAAREKIGTVPPTRSVPDRKKKRAEKHKPTLGSLLQENN